MSVVRSLPPVTILEPHADDVALSLGGWIASIAGKTRIDVVVLFSESRWAPHLADAIAVHDARMREEQRYLQQFGLHGRDFGFPDASTLGLDALEERQVEVETDSRLAAVTVSVASAVLPDAFLLMPLGVGNHIDHLVARNSRPRRFPRCAYYEELPYACHATGAEKYDLAQRVLDGPPCCWRFDISRLLDVKRAALLHYPSQLTSRDIECVLTSATDSSDAPVERVWTRAGDASVESLLESTGFVRDVPAAIVV